MSRRTPIDRNRRHLLQAMLAFPAAGIAGFTGFSGVGRGLSASEQSASLPLTPACDDGNDNPTPAQTAGPYSSRTRLNAPRSSNRDWAACPSPSPDALSPRAVADCRRAARLLAGQSQRAAGHGRAPAARSWIHRSRRTLLRATIVPGLYTGRTRHVHARRSRRITRRSRRSCISLASRATAVTPSLPRPCCSISTRGARTRRSPSCCGRKRNRTPASTQCESGAAYAH